MGGEAVGFGDCWQWSGRHRKERLFGTKRGDVMVSIRSLGVRRATTDMRGPRRLLRTYPVLPDNGYFRLQ